MLREVLLSSKLDLISRDGYALAASRQPGYIFRWHTHDCAMLLWPRVGALDIAWAKDGARHRGSFARGQALLLPAYVAHSTRAGSMVQQHGELYLAPELLRECPAHGALRLDGAAQAMLDALWMPTLSVGALPSLIRALVAQLARSRPADDLSNASLPLAQRWLNILVRALDDGRPMPTVAHSAAELGIATRTLQRACLQDHGCSPVKLRRMLLARTARERLEAGEPLASISVGLGFANSGHLGRLLREVPQNLPLNSRP